VKDEIGLRDDKREAMRSMPLERKKYLLLQSKQSRSVMGTPSSSQSSHQASSPGVASIDGVRSPISPQVTGSGLLKRFSLWGSASASPIVSTPIQEPENTEAAQEFLPIVPQITGSLWGNWWSGSPREAEKPKETDRSKPNSTEWYVDGIRNGKVTDTRLAKHLISLRVHLSTAKVAWVERFLGQEKGMDALAALLQSLVGKGGKR
jgi:diaphanous 1